MFEAFRDLWNVLHTGHKNPAQKRKPAPPRPGARLGAGGGGALGATDDADHRLGGAALLLSHEWERFVPGERSATDGG